VEEVRKEGSKVVVEIDSRIYDKKSVEEAVEDFGTPAKLKGGFGFFMVTFKTKEKTEVGYEFYNFLLDKVKERKVM